MSWYHYELGGKRTSYACLARFPKSTPVDMYFTYYSKRGDYLGACEAGVEVLEDQRLFPQFEENLMFDIMIDSMERGVPLAPLGEMLEANGIVTTVQAKMAITVPRWVDETLSGVGRCSLEKYHRLVDAGIRPYLALMCSTMWRDRYIRSSVGHNPIAPTSHSDWSKANLSTAPFGLDHVANRESIIDCIHLWDRAYYDNPAPAMWNKLKKVGAQVDDKKALRYFYRWAKTVEQGLCENFPDFKGVM